MDKKCKLLSCNKIITGNPKKKFCCKKHKNRYHNMNNPRGIYAHLHPDNITSESIENSMHPLDPYSLGQE